MLRISLFILYVPRRKAQCPPGSLFPRKYPCR